jgi:hypothetical protein
MKQVLYPILAGLTMIGAAYPQSEVPRFSGSIGAGFTTPVYGTGQRFDGGWNAGAGLVLTCQNTWVSRTNFSSMTSMSVVLP